MKNKFTLMDYLAAFIILITIIVIFLVSYHSVWEIHYYKSFYPESFTVSEVKDAVVVELVKVLLVSFPLLIVTALLVLYLSYRKSGRNIS